MSTFRAVFVNILISIEQEDGVLTPASLAELAKVHEAVANLKTEKSGLMWNDVCLQVQVHHVDYVFK